MSRNDDLVSLRARLLAALDEASPRDIASLARELRIVVAELEKVPEKGEVSKADELAAKRKARRAGAGGQPSAARRGQSRRRGGGNRTG